MKPLFLILISFLLFLFGGNKHKSDIETEHLKGKVKSLTTSTFKVVIKKKKIEKGDLMEKLVIKFDSWGNMTEETGYNPYLSTKILFKYDKKNAPIEDCRYNANDSLVERNIFIYDSEGNKIEEDHYKADNTLRFKGIFKNDERGNLIAEDSYDSSGNLVAKSIIQWDDKNNPVENEHYKGKDSLREKITYTYDANNNMIGKKYFDKKGVLTSAFVYKYDSNSNLIEASHYKTKGEFNGKIGYKFENYDVPGNWLRRISFSVIDALTSDRGTPIISDNKPYEIMEREIEYY